MWTVDQLMAGLDVDAVQDQIAPDELAEAELMSFRSDIVAGSAVMLFGRDGSGADDRVRFGIRHAG